MQSMKIHFGCRHNFGMTHEAVQVLRTPMRLCPVIQLTWSTERSSCGVHDNGSFISLTGLHMLLVILH